MSGEAQAFKSLDSLHLLLGDLDLSGCWGTRLALAAARGAGAGSSSSHGWHSTGHAGHTSTNVRVASHDHVHEGHRILLNGSEDRRIVLLEASHELLVELRVLTHALGHLSELRVGHKSLELSRDSHSWSAGATEARIFIAVISSIVLALKTTRWERVQVNTFEQKRAGEVSVASSKLQCLDTLSTIFSGNADELVDSFFVDSGRESVRVNWSSWLSLGDWLGGCSSGGSRGSGRRLIGSSLGGECNTSRGNLLLLGFLSRSSFDGLGLDSHHDDEAVLYNLVVRDGLLVVFHNFAVSNKLLSFGRLAMRLGNKGFQSTDQHLRLDFEGQLLAFQRLEGDFHFY